MESPTPLARADKADIAEVADLLEREGVVTSVPSPTFSDWVGAVAARLRDWLETAVPLGDGFATLIGTVLMWTLIAAGALVLLFLVVALVRRLRRQDRHPAEVASEETSISTAMEASKQPSEWRASVEDCLRDGDARGAIEALWWYLLASLGSERGSKTRTGRDLLRKLGRHDLRPVVLRLEHATYGPLSPPIGLARELVVAVDEALAGGARPTGVS